jgi:bifunctional DNA-binding transcriptional regulator/antitoxin component of YhaV-PrlF toxin-antitoxin module
VGTSAGIVLPKRILRRLNVERNDPVLLIEVAGGYLLSSGDPEVEEQVKAGLKLMKGYRKTFRALAK